MVTNQERQLGKKSGHAANYGVGPRTFAEACLVEMDLPITEFEAANIITGYYRAFPGVAQRQENIRSMVRRTRKLLTPLGRERQFFGRLNDDTFREAYAYAPQSTIPDVTNHLLLKLWQIYEDESDVQFLLQVHDSILLEVRIGREQEVADICRDYQSWHPELILPGGKLVIPVAVECGNFWKPMERIG